MANINLRLSDNVLAAVDEARGDVPRTRWIVRAVERALERVESERGARRAAGSIVEQPERFSPAAVESAREALAVRPSWESASADEPERPLSRVEAFRRATQKR